MTGNLGLEQEQHLCRFGIKMAPDSLQFALDLLLPLFKFQTPDSDCSFTYLIDERSAASEVLIESLFNQNRLLVILSTFAADFDDVTSHDLERVVGSQRRHEFFHLILRCNVSLLHRIDMHSVHEFVHVLYPLDGSNVAIEEFPLFASGPLVEIEDSLRMINEIITEEELKLIGYFISELQRFYERFMRLA